MIDPNNTVFSSRYNIQKIYAEGTTDVSITGFSTAVYTLTTHGLGYIPTARVFYEPFSGELWPLSPNQYSKSAGGTGNVLTITGSPVLTTNDLKVRLTNGGATTTKTFYWRIYLDE